MYTNIQILSLLSVLGAITVNAQTTPESGQLLPAQSTLLSSALSTYEEGMTSGAAYSTVASELASATSAAADLFVVLVGGDTGDVLASELSSVFSELPTDVASWVASLTSAEASIITSVLGTTQIPGADAVNFITTGSGTESGSGSVTPTQTGSVSGTGSATGKATGITSSAKSSSTGSKNAGPTLGAMSGVGCGVVAFGAAAACALGMM